MSLRDRFSVLICLICHFCQYLSIKIVEALTWQHPRSQVRFRPELDYAIPDTLSETAAVSTVSLLGGSTWLFGGTPRDGDHRAVNLVLQRAIGQDSELVADSFRISKLSFQRRIIGHHMQDQRLELRNFDRRVDIQKWTANVPDDQAKKHLRLGREPPDGQVAANHDHGDINASEDVHQIAVGLGDPLIATAQFVVDGA